MDELMRKAIVVSVIVSALVFHLVVIVLPSYSDMVQVEARDFSAYYIGAWRLYHSPGMIYAIGLLDTDYVILPRPCIYKYPPQFLLMMSPFLLLDYQTAFYVFDILQFLMLPIIAFMLYDMLNDRNIFVIVSILLIVLLQPLPYLSWYDKTPVWVSQSYHFLWIAGNAKVFATFLLILSFYFGHEKEVVLSAVAFSLAFFDPRFAFLSIPLAIFYNLGNLKKFFSVTIVSLMLLNSVALYADIGVQFINASFSDIDTPMFSYSWIPFYTIVALSIAEFGNLGYCMWHRNKARIG